MRALPAITRLLVQIGELLVPGKTEKTFRPGDVFHLRANEPHWESYGADGVVYLVGRKQVHGAAH